MAGMSHRHRKAISLVMSLLLMIFSICQVQARAAVLPEPVAADTMAMADCHGAVPAVDAAMDCHGICAHLSQHHDSLQKSPLPDVTPLLLALRHHHEQTVAPLLRVGAYQSPDRHAVDPPVAIRFQRFLN